MRILITGARGFIGGHLSKHLASRGHELQPFVRGDSLDLIASFKPEVCIHLAGRSSVRESLQNPALYEDANCRFSMALLEALRGAGTRRVIHASTVMIYGKDAPLPYAEDRIGSTPASFYGASKLAIEAQMNTWQTLHGVETINLRIFSVYGPGLRPDCVPHLIASAILEGRTFNIFGNGSSIRDYVAVGDVVSAFDAALNAQWGSDFPLALNIGSGRGTSLMELIGMLETGLQKKLKIEFKPPVAGELHAIVADVSRARQFLDWQPRANLGAEIRALSVWFQTRQK